MLSLPFSSPTSNRTGVQRHRNHPKATPSYIFQDNYMSYTIQFISTNTSEKRYHKMDKSYISSIYVHLIYIHTYVHLICFTKW